MAVIYRITNMANGKYYIGSADSFARRQWQHKYDLKRGQHKNPRLQAAWDKYGEEMFVFEVLEEIPEGRSPLQVEDAYLMQHVGQPDCYNINPSAELSRLGLKHTEESKQRVSAGRKGKHAGEQHYRYGQTISEEVRKKIGDTQRGVPKAPGRTLTPEGRAKVQANIAAGRSHKHWLGRTHTQEAKDRMSRRVVAIPPYGMPIIYRSITALRDALALTPATVNRAVKSGKPLSKGPKKGWVFKYVDTAAPQ